MSPRHVCWQDQDQAETGDEEVGREWEELEVELAPPPRATGLDCAGAGLDAGAPTEQAVASAAAAAEEWTVRLLSGTLSTSTWYGLQRAAQRLREAVCVCSYVCVCVRACVCVCVCVCFFLF